MGVGDQEVDHCPGEGPAGGPAVMYVASWFFLNQVDNVVGGLLLS